VMASMKNPDVVLWYAPVLMLVCFSLTMHLKVSKTQYDRVWSYIESGKQDGAKVLVGGERRTTPGYWVDATSPPASIVLPGSAAANSFDSIHRHSP
jgi:hypothetical protein